MNRNDLIESMLEDIYNATKDFKLAGWDSSYWKGFCKASEFAWGYSDLYKDLYPKAITLLNNMNAKVTDPFLGLLTA